MPILGFRLDVYHHVGDDNLTGLLETLQQLVTQGEMIMGTQEETAEELRTLKAQLLKATDEINAKIAALVAAADAAKNTDPALQAAVDDLKPVGQLLDDIGDPNV